MRIFTKPRDLAAQCREWRAAGDTIALVPTMGYYHAGHQKLMEYGRANAKRLVVSLFVNPAQFGPGEDLAAYPRDFERDRAIAEAVGADALFAPAPEDFYYPDHAAWVVTPNLARGLCGASRPIHFRGVCTVVLKLLLVSQADLAVFGEKDWQQQAIIKRMVRDLNVPATIVALPTVREADGLAMSSRNVYLTRDERRVAPHLRKGLELAAELTGKGVREAPAIIAAVRDYWRRHMPQAETDYLTLVHPESLKELQSIEGSGLLACAVKLGKARLIDNILLQRRDYAQ
ncbi:MAG: pantoate--beta-alanine ligase [Desulfovibrio sp.]|nr:pantoate--beta-alanine ligase [Desulfovibrio sp.]